MTKNEWLYTWIVTSLLSVVKMADSLPDIHISGAVSINQTINLNRFTFVCSSDSAFMGCTVEFFFNKTTKDDLRRSANECYHKNGVCEPFVCQCSENCKNFTLSVILLSDMTNHIFGCGGKIENRTANYRVTASVIYDGESFHHQKSIIELITDVTKSNRSSQYLQSNMVAVLDHRYPVETGR